jgi:hypothetical protein
MSYVFNLLPSGNIPDKIYMACCNNAISSSGQYQYILLAPVPNETDVPVSTLVFSNNYGMDWDYITLINDYITSDSVQYSLLGIIPTTLSISSNGLYGLVGYNNIDFMNNTYGYNSGPVDYGAQLIFINYSTSSLTYTNIIESTPVGTNTLNTCWGDISPNGLYMIFCVQYLNTDYCSNGTIFLGCINITSSDITITWHAIKSSSNTRISDNYIVSVSISDDGYFLYTSVDPSGGYGLWYGTYNNSSGDFSVYVPINISSSQYYSYCAISYDSSLFLVNDYSSQTVSYIETTDLSGGSLTTIPNITTSTSTSSNIYSTPNIIICNEQYIIIIGNTYLNNNLAFIGPYISYTNSLQFNNLPVTIPSNSGININSSYSVSIGTDLSSNINFILFTLNNVNIYSIDGSYPAMYLAYGSQSLILDSGPTGPTGPSGLQGLKGDTGLQGLLGDTGPTGPQGLKGDTGLQGLLGDTGPSGLQGLLGDTGPSGLQGLKGDTGPSGLQGLKGDTGPSGLQGLKGDTGLFGLQGIKGDTGLFGDTGPTGPQGIQGPPGTFTMTKPVITTNPSQVTSGIPFTLTYYNPNYLPIIGDTYDLRNQLGVQVSDVYTANNDINFIFTNVILTSGLNLLYIYNITTGSMSPKFTKNIESINVDVSSICFKEKTKILCNVDNQERYIPIEQLDDTVYVKTYKHGYKKIKYLLKSKIINSKEKTINKLYVMKKTKNNNLIEDLYVTGSHALLKDEISEHNKNRMKQITSELKYDLKIDDKYKIIACFDKRFQEFNEPGYFNIYHLVLETDNETFKNYGIYANGILAESTDEITLGRMKDYKLINLDE